MPTEDYRPSVSAMMRAQNAGYLDASRNGLSGARPRTRKPLRLPTDVWENIHSMATHLLAAFPDRYVTLTSTLEFIINEGLENMREAPPKDLRTSSNQIPLDFGQDGEE